MFKRLIHPRSLSRTINISMLNLISIGTEKRKTWEDELPFSINDTPFVKTFLINEEKGDESKRRKEETQRIADLSIPTTATCLPLFLDLIKNLSLRSDSLRSERKEKEKHGIEQTSLEDFIPDSFSLFPISVRLSLADGSRETKKEDFKWQICTRNSENYTFFEKSFVDYGIFKFKFQDFLGKNYIWSYTTGKLIQIMKIRGSKDNLMIHWNI